MRPYKVSTPLRIKSHINKQINYVTKSIHVFTCGAENNAVAQTELFPQMSIHNY